MVALYPSPAGATESELDLHGFGELSTLNPLLAELEADAEALVVNRLSEPPQYAIVPIDQCYMLVGMIRAGWEGISGGDAVERAVTAFFDGLQEKALRDRDARRSGTAAGSARLRPSSPSSTSSRRSSPLRQH